MKRPERGITTPLGHTIDNFGPGNTESILLPNEEARERHNNPHTILGLATLNRNNYLMKKPERGITTPCSGTPHNFWPGNTESILLPNEEARERHNNPLGHTPHRLDYDEVSVG
jgi:hypothetical protein